MVKYDKNIVTDYKNMEYYGKDMSIDGKTR